MLAQIGDFLFDINDTSFDNFKRTTNYRFNVNQRLGNFDNYQSSGLHEDSIEIKGSLVKKSQNQISELKRIAAQKLPQTLASADGTCETVIILGIEQDKSSFLKGGQFLKQEYKIDIAVVGDGYSFNG